MDKEQRWILGRVLMAVVLLVGLEFGGARQPWLYIVPWLVAGYDILYQAVRHLMRGDPFDENFLMAAATSGAMFLGEYGEAAAVMIFYQVGELFQDIAVSRSRQHLLRLMDMRPQYANLEQDGRTVRVSAETVQPGMVVLVGPGEKVPVDGIVLSGKSRLDLHILTGESRPRGIGAGDEVFSGCVNLSGVLRVKTTKAAAESAAAKILELVESSSAKKARAERFITRFARIYTPAVCAAALLLAVGVPLVRWLVLGLPPLWPVWMERALILLVISCPCALVISIPLSFFGGIGKASSHGVLIKGANDLEALARAQVMVFDKTGTLTQGDFAVTQVRPQGMSREQLLAYAAAAESWSSHPISRSLQAAAAAPIKKELVRDYEETSGEGITAVVSGHLVAVGNDRLMARLGLVVPSAPAAYGTVVQVAVDGKYAGCILAADAVRPQAAPALAALRAGGVRQLVMLTGDTPAAAAAAAEQLDLDAWTAGLLPAGKAAAVEKLLAEKEAGTSLAFVGDGINDAPVLVRADIGIAMGALGSDAAVEAADIVLMDDDLTKISLARQIAQKTLHIVHQNIALALGTKAACLLLGALGLVNMWLAVFADVGVMVLAVLNAVRILAGKLADLPGDPHVDQTAAKSENRCGQQDEDDLRPGAPGETGA